MTDIFKYATLSTTELQRLASGGEKYPYARDLSKGLEAVLAGQLLIGSVEVQTVGEVETLARIARDSERLGTFAKGRNVYYFLRGNAARAVPRILLEERLTAAPLLHLYAEPLRGTLMGYPPQHIAHAYLHEASWRASALELRHRLVELVGSTDGRVTDRVLDSLGPPSRPFLSARVTDLERRLGAPHAAPLTGDEPFEGSPFTVRDFWRWGFSDLRAASRDDTLAQFLVAAALRVEAEVGEMPMAMSGYHVRVSSPFQYAHDPNRDLDFFVVENCCVDSSWADAYVMAVPPSLGTTACLDLDAWRFQVLTRSSLKKYGSVFLPCKNLEERPVAWSNLRWAVRQALLPPTGMVKGWAPSRHGRAAGGAARPRSAARRRPSEDGASLDGAKPVLAGATRLATTFRAGNVSLDVLLEGALTGHEAFEGTGLTVTDYWRWAFSNLMRAPRDGLLGTFLVASALRVQSSPVDELLPFDGFEVRVCAPVRSQESEECVFVLYSDGRLSEANACVLAVPPSGDRSALGEQPADRARPLLRVADWRFHVLSEDRARNGPAVFVYEQVTEPAVSWNDLAQALRRVLRAKVPRGPQGHEEEVGA